MTERERETLKSIYRLGGPEGTARPGDLAEALSVSPATITARLKKMAEAGLVEHQPYHGVMLTREGRIAAVDAIRRHRIVERFLSDMLGYPWDGADRLAVTFEHSLPNEVVQRLYAALDRPTTCPHGFPIPEAEADEVIVLASLADAEPGDVVEVAIAGDTHPDVVAFLETLGIRPGTPVTVREQHPFEGPVVISVDGTERVLGHGLASGIYISKTGKSER
ncbi:MAG TPA: metal-dependent transcriptional regulator [Acidimicrobiia bacterium]|jgi:DtxR family Mn-dependent transcriptional regulator|nr:metal-dependent transcriptional regulator [Acidimicrobiia bacterium]